MTIRSTISMVLLLAGSILPASVSEAAYTVTKLDDLIPHDSTTSRNYTGHALNDDGSIAGQYSYYSPGFSAQPFFWSQSTGTIAMNYASYNMFDLVDINNNNQVAFNLTGGSSDNGVYLWSPSMATPQFLGNMNGNTMQVGGINDSGHVVGWKLGGGNAGIWDSTNGWTQLAGQSGEARAVNDSDVAVGVAVAAPGDPQLASYWDATGVHNLPAGTYFAQDINAQGAITGVTSTATQHAFFYDQGALNDIGALDPTASSQGRAINNKNEIVGSGFLNPGGGAGAYTFIWDETNGMRDLNSLLQDPNWNIIDTYDINNNSAILAGALYEGNYYSVLLQPVVTPEPASMALFGLGAGALALARKRKKSSK